MNTPPQFPLSRNRKSKTFRRGFPAVILAAVFVLTAPLFGQNELISNDQFSDGGDSWKLQPGRNAMANQSVVTLDEEPALQIEVENLEQKPADVRVQRVFGEIADGTTYVVRFQAKAAVPAKIIPYIYPEKERARVLWRVEANLDTEWQEFSFSFQSPGAGEECVLGFSQLGGQTNSFWFKDVTLSVE